MLPGTQGKDQAHKLGVRGDFLDVSLCLGLGVTFWTFDHAQG